MGRNGTHSCPAGQSFLQNTDPAGQNRNQLIPLPFFHGHQSLHQTQRIPAGKTIHKSFRLGRQSLTGLKQLLCLTQPTAAAGNGCGNVFAVCLGKFWAKQVYEGGESGMDQEPSAFSGQMKAYNI